MAGVPMEAPPAPAPWGVTVCLASGRAAALAPAPEERLVRTVRTLASEALGCRVTALLTEGGARLEEGRSLDEQGVQDGATLTAVAGELKIYPSKIIGTRLKGPGAFLAIAGDVFVATWGNPDSGGDCSSVVEELRANRVVQVCSTVKAFAAVTGQGTVITWGNRYCGGDSSEVARQLFAVHVLTASKFAFAALNRWGSVMAWGDPSSGGSTWGVRSELYQEVRDLRATSNAFAALREGGRVVTWGRAELGGDSRGVAERLQGGMQSLLSTPCAFAGLRDDGGVVTWGVGCGGAGSPLQADLERGVASLACDGVVFRATKADGKTVTWGCPGYDQLAAQPGWQGGVRQVVVGTQWALAVTADGQLLPASLGGPPDFQPAFLRKLPQERVVALCAGANAFAATTESGGVLTWGDWMDEAHTGDSSAVRSELSGGVQQVFSNGTAFAAVKREGAVVTWGLADDGGDSSAVRAELGHGVQQVFGSDRAFAAVKADGHVVTWGTELDGCDGAGARAALNWPRG